MDLLSVLRMVRKTWTIVLALTLLGGGVGAVVAYLTPPSYSSTTKLYFAFESPAGASAADLVQANNFAVQKVFSYVQVVETPRVLDRVIAQLGLDSTADELARDITVSAPLETVVLDISASAGNPEDAATLTNTVGSAFTDVVINELESPTTGGAGPVRAEVLEEATAPDSPSSPSYPLDIVLGLFIGLVTGLLVTVVLAVADRRVHNRGELERLLEVPVLAGITGAGSRFTPLGPAAEADGFRALATALMLESGITARRTVTIVAPTRREDTSVVTAQLGVALCRAGLRVVLVDGDPQRARLSRLFELPDRPGLRERLAGTAVEPLATDVPGLRLLPAGAPTTDSEEPLATPRLAELLDELAAGADLVVIDSPPVLGSSTAGFLAAATGSTALVVQAGRTTTVESRSAESALTRAGAHLVGTILTDVPTSGPDADAHTRALADSSGRTR